MAGALLRAALVASCFRGALPPVDLRAVCLVRAIVSCSHDGRRTENEAERAGCPPFILLCELSIAGTVSIPCFARF